MSVQEFLSMGGYAAYVWPAYGIVLAVLLWNIWGASRAHAEARKMALRRLEIEENRQ